MRLLIKNGIILTDTFNFIKKNILIEDGKIIYIGEDEKNFDEIFDAKDKLVLPGFINSHIHFGECFLRGYLNRLKTDQYIDYAERFNLNNIKQQEQMRSISTKITIYESEIYGTTSFIGIRGYKETSILPGNFYLGYPFMKSPKLSKYLENACNNLDILRKNKRVNQHHYIFIHSLTKVDENILNIVSNYYNKNDLYLAIHFLETKEEREKVKKQYGLYPIEVLEKYKLLNERTLLIHGCYLKNEDLDKLKRYGCSICICPTSNLKLQNRIPNVEEMIKRNINILIGTDGGATNDSFSLIEEAKLLSLLTKIKEKEIIKMFTMNPNKFFRSNKGSIRVNNQADLIFYQLDTSFTFNENYLNNLIYKGQHKVSDMIINGEFIIKDYKHRYLDSELINKEKEEIIINIKNKI